MRRRRFASYANRLRAELAGVRDEFLDIIERSEIRYVNPNTADSSVFFVGAADWGWSPTDTATTAARMGVLGRYRDWHRRVELLFPHPTPEVGGELDEVHGFIVRWLERPDAFDYSIPQTTAEARKVAQQHFSRYEALLDMAATGSGLVRLVPDTSALLDNPDLASYEPAAGTAEFHVHVVPMVLSELDQQKDHGRTPELKLAAQAVIRRFKGLRDRGNVTVGVNLTKTITVKLEARETDPSQVLDWLDPSVPDDRILGAALRLQSDHPGDVVVLVTSDLNLQTKAEAAGLPYSETPANPATLRANLRVEIGYRVSNEAGHVPVATIKNDGPAAATDVEFSITSSGDAVPKFTAGPWRIERLHQKATSEGYDVYGAYTDPAEAHVAWTDGAGKHQQVTSVSFPPPPPARQVARRIR